MEADIENNEIKPQELEMVVNGVPTRVISFGGGIGDVRGVDCVVLIIPGNPGIIDFYTEFMACLYKDLTKESNAHSYLVMGICHAGHLDPSICEKSIPDPQEHPNLYDLRGQTLHKLAFIREHLGGKQLILITHSIGSRMCIDALREDPEVGNQLRHAFLLFPAIHKLRDTPNGRFFWALKPYYNWFIQPLIFPLFFIPRKVKRIILQLYFAYALKYDQTKAGRSIDAALQLMNRCVANQCLELARNELDTVLEPDLETLEKYVDRFHFYQAEVDGWCPQGFTKELSDQISGLDVTLCGSDVRHAFVVDSSSKMAGILAERILSQMKI